MASSLPQRRGRAQGNPYLVGMWAPARSEHTQYGCQVVLGSIPTDLDGSFLKVRPNPPSPARRHALRMNKPKPNP